jgi:2'-5' RNA ligase
MAQPDFSGHSMLALYPPAAVARKLAIPGGLDPAEMHVTVAYTGLAADTDRKQLRKTAKALADRPPITATISGHARLTAAGDQDVIVALVDSPALDDLRGDALGELADRGVDVARNHSTLHHITLAYVGKDDPDPVGRLVARPVTFSGVTASHGSNRKTRAFDTTVAEAAREAYLTGWALSGGPLTDAVAHGAEAAVRVALENADDPHVLEATLNIGKLKGLWALYFARREQIIADGIAAVRKAWQSAAGKIGVIAVVDRLLAELGPWTGDGLSPERANAAAAAAAALLSGMYAAEEHGDLLAAVQDALLSGMAEGAAGALALNAEQAGYTVITGLEKAADAEGQVFSFDLAYQQVYAQLANLPDLPLMAQGWIQRIIGGAAADTGKLLARMLAADATRKEMIAALTDALDAGAEADGASARAVALFMDQAISQAMSRAALQLYASEGVADVYWVTAGDSRVCAACQELEDNSPYTPDQAPAPGEHPLCRCVLTCTDPAPFQALAQALL